MLFDWIRRYYYRPHIALVLFIRRVVYKSRYLWIKYVPRLKGMEVELSKNVRFYQKTIVSGDGYIRIGENTSFGYILGGGYRYNVTEIQPRFKTSKIVIGKNVAFNNSAFICSAGKIEIKDDCLLGANLNIFDFEAHGTSPSRRKEIGSIGEVIIEQNAWIGSNVTILKNVYIGENSIVAAGSVVLKGRYPANSIIAGNPAKVVKEIKSNDIS